MDADHETTEIAPDDFARRFSMRAANLMWFLGAGASAAAGVPTAYDLIWEFKQRLFISQRRISAKSVSDLASESIRTQIQTHIDSLGNMPRRDSPDEYARLFETVYPAERDRRAFIESKLSGAKPSFGHIALATLMRAQLLRLVWTTNFDALVADACAKVYDGTAALMSGTLETSEAVARRIAENRWPVEIKLHGDFRSRSLKNTPDELRFQDARLRRLLIDCCSRFGLIVVGYSGRDTSILETLEEALTRDDAFPNGLFWLYRDGDSLLPRVTNLLKSAIARGIDAAFVRAQNFDESLSDLVRLLTDIDTKVLDNFAKERKHRTPAPAPTGRLGWPIIRLNALPIIRFPLQCRKIVCDIGGHRDLTEAVQNSALNVLAARVKAGVLAFGSDADIRSVFENHGITEFDLHPIESSRLRYESGERGLLRRALSHSISRARGLEVYRRRNTDLFAPQNPDDTMWVPLRRIVAPLHGVIETVPRLFWREGLGTRLEWANNRLWLLIQPRIVFDGIVEENRSAATEFARERSVKRYNRMLNDLVAFWADVLAGDGTDIRALGIADGVDATFALSRNTAFSRRVGA